MRDSALYIYIYIYIYIDIDRYIYIYIIRGARGRAVGSSTPFLETHHLRSLPLFKKESSIAGLGRTCAAGYYGQRGSPSFIDNFYTPPLLPKMLRLARTEGPALEIAGRAKRRSG